MHWTPTSFALIVWAWSIRCADIHQVLADTLVCLGFISAAYRRPPTTSNSVASPLPNPSGALLWALSQICSVLFSTDSPLTRVGCTSSTDCTEFSLLTRATAHSEEELNVLLPSSCWAPATGTEKSSVIYGHRMDSRLWSTDKRNHRYQCVLIGRICSPTLQLEEQHWKGCASWDSPMYSPRGYTNLLETTGELLPLAISHCQVMISPTKDNTSQKSMV